jgi:hypothetical protein
MNEHIMIKVVKWNEEGITPISFGLSALPSNNFLPVSSNSVCMTALSVNGDEMRDARCEMRDARCEMRDAR